ncbi:MAG: kelch repeat-containing protein, partial [Chloroflexota bacterium]
GHSVTLTGLLANTTYNYRVKSRDAAGNLAMSANQSFVTLSQASSGIPSTLGWFQIPNTQQGDVCPPDAFGYSFSSKCGSVIGAWGGGIADTARNRIIVWGGGHGDYAGNELYALELSTLTMKRLNNPSPPTSGSSPAASDGKANSRHTYNGLANVEHLDKMFAFSGSLYSSGVAVNDTWLLDLATLTWKRVSATGPSGDYNVHAHYDAVTKKVFVADRSSLWRFDADTEQYTRVGSLGMGLATTSVIDPKRRILFVFGTDWGGSKQFSAINVDTGQPVSMTLSGCDGLISSAAPGNGEGSGPGLAYDPVQDRIVGWVTGNTVYIFNPDTQSCTTQSFTGGPGAPTQQGIYGRFRYFPALGVFALVNQSNQDSYTLRLTPAQSAAQAGEVVISGLAAVNITASSATVVWSTSMWADGQIACGVFAPDGIRSPLDLTPAVNHAHTLNFLDPDMTYQCQAMSRNSAGQQAVSPVFSFRTAK